MIVEQALIDRIRWHSKERVLRIPVRRGRLKDGSSYRKRCPLRAGGTYTLKPRAEYDRWVQEARAMPRGRGVLWLFDRCWEPGRTVTITVLSPPCIDGEEWAVVFAVGRHEVAERPVYLARHGDYTLQRSQGVKGEPQVLMPLEEDLEKARRKAVEERLGPQELAVRRAAGETETLGRSIESMKARRLIRDAARKLERAAMILSEPGLESVSSSSAQSEVTATPELGPSMVRPPRDADLATPEAA